MTKFIDQRCLRVLTAVSSSECVISASLTLAAGASQRGTASIDMAVSLRSQDNGNMSEMPTKSDRPRDLNHSRFGAISRDFNEGSVAQLARAPS